MNHEEHKADMKMPGMKMPGMKMYFHGGYQEMILFHGWQTKSVGEFVGSCIFFAILAFLYEGLKVGRVALAQMSLQQRGGSISYIQSQAQGQPEVNGAQLRSSKTVWKSWRFIGPTLALTYGFQYFLAYILMLTVMTYNIWLCLSVVLGAIGGSYVFVYRTKRKISSDIISGDHCM